MSEHVLPKIETPLMGRNSCWTDIQPFYEGLYPARISARADDQRERHDVEIWLGTFLSKTDLIWAAAMLLPLPRLQADQLAQAPAPLRVQLPVPA
jgi:hypothetical protein